MNETASTTAAAASTTSCCIVGGGPAGMMLGFLLARQGVQITVLEKHSDFFRDFRGDTIHPSTMTVLDELGLLDEFLTLPHTQTKQIAASIGKHSIILADFSHLKVKTPFIAFMPQWDFLEFIRSKAAAYPNFHLMMGTQATSLIEEGGKIAGIQAKNAQGDLEVRADLVVAADGRHSTLRDCSGLKITTSGAPMDVLWFRVSRKTGDPVQLFGRIDHGRMMVLIDRDTYWQCAFLIPKGDFEAVKSKGLDALRTTVAALLPWLTDRVNELTDWDDIKLLTVKVDHLKTWCKPGLLVIGDAAHAMSPVGGVGINLAIQDAVASANMLGPALKRGQVSLTDLQRIQKRRLFPARMIQRLQIFIQNRLIRRVLTGDGRPQTMPWPMRLARRLLMVRRLMGRLIGVGVRPEHVL